jgi:hypothetical protein
MYWLSKRVTTRIEDIAYCMLGIFGINMPLLYGEGSKAFTRLQEEIIKVSNDHTIFCWTWLETEPEDWSSLLAPSPDTFKYSRSYIRSDLFEATSVALSVYTNTNAGLSISLPIIQSWSTFLVMLNAAMDTGRQRHYRVCLTLRGEGPNQNKLFQRDSFPTEVIHLPQSWATDRHNIFVKSRYGEVTSWIPAAEIPCNYLFILITNSDQVRAMVFPPGSQLEPGPILSMAAKNNWIL